MTDNKENLPVQQDFALHCVDKMQSIPENLPEKIKTIMMDTLVQRMEMFIDQEEANNLAASNLLPKGYEKNPANIMLAFKTGRSLGLDRLQSLQHTFTVNGRTRVYGDMMLALSMKHKDYKDIKFEYGPDVVVDPKHGKLPEFVKCIVILEERENVESVYTLENAKRNPNFSSGPWITGHARRMMKFRAQSFSLRDAFPDKLSGVYDEYEFEEIQTVTKNINAETTDLGSQSGTNNLKDSLKSDEATEPVDVEIQDKDGKPVKVVKAETEKEPEVKPQAKPENTEQMKTNLKKWATDKIITKKEYDEFVSKGSSGEWDRVVEMHKTFSQKAAKKTVSNPIGKFVKKLSKIVDLEDYADSINSLVTDENNKILTSDNVAASLRTKDEKLAKEVFNLIEDRKDIIDSAKKDPEGEAY